MREGRGNNSAALHNIRLFVLDMDGTITLEHTPINGAVELCKTLFETGRLLYFTNNASRSSDDYVKKLTEIGFPATRRTIVTSGDVTAAYLNRHHKGQSVFLLGTPQLRRSFSEYGIPLSNDAGIVVVSFDLTLTYEKLSHACSLIQNGARFFSTHPDINCPVKGGFIPDSGAICKAISASTGVTPRFFGKPHAETAELLERFSGVSRNRMAVIGDRLYTDIALGRRNGILSVLVMTGETTPEMLREARSDCVPDLVYDSVSDILGDL